MRPAPKPYRPWRSNLIGATCALAICAGTGYGAFVSAQSGLDPTITAAAAGSCLVAALATINQLGQLRRRRHGQRVERQAGPSLQRELREHSMKSRTNVLMRGVGDIDVVHDQSDGQSVPIEIKSFVLWKQWWIFPGRREREAYRQVQGQIEALRAPRGYIWLPNGKPTLLQRVIAPRRGAVRVLFGSPSRVARALKR